MSTIHNSEPQAFGSIQLVTTFGTLELELFTKQCPKISRNFVQLCLDGYYESTTFDRVEKDFIAIGGKYAHDLPIETQINPDEFHSRLKFSRRGLLATANTDKNANGPEFFFTLGPTPELQNKHSIFGRLKGDSVYHLVDLNECPVDEELVPISEKKILQVIVQDNPFPDLKPRPEVVHALKKHRNDDQLPIDEPQQGYQEYLEPKLEIKSSSKKLSFYADDSDEEDDDGGHKDEEPVARDSSGDLMRDEEAKPQKAQDEFKKPPSQADTATASRLENPNGLTSEEIRQKRLQELRENIQTIKKQIESESGTKIRDRRRSQDQNSSLADSIKSSSSKQSSVEDPDLSNQELRMASKKGRHRERETLELMKNFKKKLKQTAESSNVGPLHTRDPPASKSDDILRCDLDGGDDDESDELAKALDLVDGDAWMRHRFEAAEGQARDAKDANQKGDDWYSIDDPRNPLVQRVEADKARDYERSRSRHDHHDDHHSHRSRSRSKESSRHDQTKGHHHRR